MAKKSSIKISSAFWKGLILGIIITLTFAFIYFKFFPVIRSFPPTNGSAVECMNNCHANESTCLAQCPTGSNTCQADCRNSDTACILRCNPFY